MLGHCQWLADAAGDAAGLVGRRHELRLLRQAVTLRRPVFLLGPPGVSKTSIRAAIDLPSLLAARASVLRGGADPDLLRCLVCAAFTGRVRVRPAVSRPACDLVMELFSGPVSQTPGGWRSCLPKRAAAAPGPAPGDAGEAEAGPGQDGVGQGGTHAAARTATNCRAWNGPAALDGTEVPVRASTVCVHSDTPGAELLGPAVRAVFDDLSVRVQAPLAGQGKDMTTR